MRVRERVISICREEGKPFRRLYLYSLFLYLPLIVLRLTNSMDGMWDQDDHVTGAAELRIGRWFWPYLDRLRLNISLDPFPALVSLALFTAGFLLALSALRLRRTWITCGAGLIFLSSPAVLCQLSYSYMSITFAVGFLLAVLAVQVLTGGEPSGTQQPADETAAEKEAAACDMGTASRPVQQLLRNPRIPASAVLIALMMGCYQAFLGVTCVLALFVFLLLLKREREVRRAFSFALQMLVSLVLGAVLYELCLHACLAYYGETLSDYNGADAITFSGVLGNLPASLRHTFVSFRYYYGQSGSRFHALQGQGWFPVLYAVPAAGAVLLLGQAVQSGGERDRSKGGRLRKGAETGEERQGSRRNGSLLRAGLMVLALVLIPVYANSFFLLAASSETQMQMTGGMALSLPLLLCLWEEVLHGEMQTGETVGEESGVFGSGSFPDRAGNPTGAGRRGRLLRGICAAGMAALLYGAAAQAVTDEYAMYAGRQVTATLAGRVLDQLALAGTDYTEQVVMVYGQPAQSPLFRHTELYDRANCYAQYGNWAAGTEANRLCWSNFFGTQLRVNVNYAQGDTLETIYHSPEVAAMPVYPAAGSTASVWGVTVVKISE